MSSTARFRGEMDGTEVGSVESQRCVFSPRGMGADLFVVLGMSTSQVPQVGGREGNQRALSKVRSLRYPTHHLSWREYKYYM